MQVDELPAIDPNVDYMQIVPIQQKRTIAFINHFIMNTVSYLNNFSQCCESRFMEFEYKLQKVEASLLILESQLSSISGLDTLENNSVDKEVSVQNSVRDEIDVSSELPEVKEENIVECIEKSADIIDGVKACEDPRYKKFFKMVQFGVPGSAVKLKMKSEGFDPTILDSPNVIIPGLTLEEPKCSEVNSGNSSDS